MAGGWSLSHPPWSPLHVLPSTTRMDAGQYGNKFQPLVDSSTTSDTHAPGCGHHSAWCDQLESHVLRRQARVAHIPTLAFIHPLENLTRRALISLPTTML